MSKHFYEAHNISIAHELTLRPFAIMFNEAYWYAAERWNNGSDYLPPNVEHTYIVFTNTSNQKFILRLMNTCNGNHYIFDNFIRQSSWVKGTWKILSSIDKESISEIYEIELV